jgi:hypothetical protein
MHLDHKDTCNKTKLFGFWNDSTGIKYEVNNTCIDLRPQVINDKISKFNRHSGEGRVNHFILSQQMYNARNNTKFMSKDVVQRIIKLQYDRTRFLLVINLIAYWLFYLPFIWISAMNSADLSSATNFYFNILFLIINLYFLGIEMIQMWYIGLKNYLRSGWNYCDLSVHLSFIVFFFYNLSLDPVEGK